MLRITIVFFLIIFSILHNEAALAQPLTDIGLEKLDTELAVKIEKMDSSESLNIVVKFELPTNRKPETKKYSLDIDAPDLERRNAILETRQRLFDSSDFKEIREKRRRMKRRHRRHMIGSLRYAPYIGMEATKDEILKIARSPRVEYIYESGVGQLNLPESTSGTLTNASTTRALGFKGSGQTIAIIDTGVAAGHNHIGEGKVVAGTCFTDDPVCVPLGESDPRAPGTPGNDSGGPEDSIDIGNAHGTLVAGIAASKNATYAGVAPDAKLISARVFGSNGSFSANFSLDVAGALEWIYDLRHAHQIAAVNMSFRSSGQLFSTNCDSADRAIADAVRRVNDAGIAVIAASGNSGSATGISIPACLSGVISVGMTGDGSGSAAFDVVDDRSNSASNLDLLAPGDKITGAGTAPNGLYANSGTSFASPHVAGAFAVLKSAVPTATNAQILTALKETGKPITDTRNGLTRPRIEVYEALQYLQHPPETPIDPAPDDPTTTIAVVPLNGFTLIHSSGQ